VPGWKAENNPEADTERKSLLKELDPKGFPFVDSPNRGVPSWEIRRLGRGREPTVSFLRKQESRKNRPTSGNFFVGANRHPTAYNKKILLLQNESGSRDVQCIHRKESHNRGVVMGLAPHKVGISGRVDTVKRDMHSPPEEGVPLHKK
jgi:hypothetical protein